MAHRIETLTGLNLIVDMGHFMVLQQVGWRKTAAFAVQPDFAVLDAILALLQRVVISLLTSYRVVESAQRSE